MDEERKKEYPKALRNRLARVHGHLGKVKEMADEGAEFGALMMQLAAVRSSLSGISNALVKEELMTTFVEAVHKDDDERIDELNEIIAKYL
ncbi:MAG: metal-sensing transcriptional repressor [Candidatus Spyradocola sp.]